MNKYIFLYGTIAAVVIIVSMIAGVALAGESGAPGLSAMVGYLVMIVALSLIFVAIKRYRDQELGGVIKFGRALMLGLAISALAGVGYVISWEIYLEMTDHAFIGKYTESILQQKREAGVAGADYAQLEQEMAVMEEQYAKPLYRLPMTFLELFPVGLLISLVSAGLLRNSRFLPA
jgi:hypothetical protein